MQLKLHLLEPVGNIGIIHTLHKHCPAMRMIRRCSLWLRIPDWIEGPSCGTIDKGTEGLDALDALLSIARRSHGVNGLWRCVDGVKLGIEDNQAEDKRDSNRDGKARLSGWSKIILSGG